MPNIKRTPPTTSRGKLKHTQSRSDPDLTAAVEEINQNITTRYKRPRSDSSPRVEQDMANSTLATFKKELLNMLEEWKSEQKQILSQLVSDVTQLKLQCSAIHNTNMEIEKSIVSLNNDYEDILRKVSEFEKQQTEYKESINKLEKQIIDLQQRSRTSAIEIRNIPAIPNETTDSLLKVIARLGSLIQMEVPSINIRDIYRLPARPGQSKSIFVEFSSVQMKNSFLSSIRKYNKERTVAEKLNTSSIGIPGDCRPVYVEEHLPQSSKRIFYLAREFAKRNKFSFCWVSNGKILIRKNAEATQTYLIKTEQCLINLERKQ